MRQIIPVTGDTALFLVMYSFGEAKATEEIQAQLSTYMNSVVVQLKKKKKLPYFKTQMYPLFA